MTTLGSEFAVLMLVSGNWHTLDRLERGLDKIRDEDDLTFAIRKTGERPTRDDMMPYMVDGRWAVSWGVRSRGVVRPKAPIELGRKTVQE